MLIAALKFRFNFCEKKKFTFKRLIKESKKKNPHKVIAPADLDAIFTKSKKNLEICVAFHLMYDLAARV